MKVLVTGGAGYIGSTAVQVLLKKGFDVNVIDDLSTGHLDSLAKGVNFINGSILDLEKLKVALTDCEAVIHFAAKSLVGESVLKPDLYREVNIVGTENLISLMKESGITKLVYSSSAATYGAPSQMPILESAETTPTNPYGESKLATDHAIGKSGLSAISLRYFNVAGALFSNGKWNAERHNPETHLIPNILKSTHEKPMRIFGTDWPTKDGTCIRDYVHVVDLVEAHIAALDNLPNGRHEIINLGSGSGYSVLEVVSAAERVTNQEIPVINDERRAGDPAILIASIEKAKKILNWMPTLGIEKIVEDTWKSLQ